MSEETLGNLQLIHLIIYTVSLFVFMKASFYGVRFPDNKKYWVRTVIPTAIINAVIFLLYTFWV